MIDAFLGGIPLPFHVKNVQDAKQFLIENAYAIEHKVILHLIENEVEDQRAEETFVSNRKMVIEIHWVRSEEMLDTALDNMDLQSVNSETEYDAAVTAPTQDYNATHSEGCRAEK